MMLTVLLADVIILVMMYCRDHNLAYDLILICSCKALLDSDLGCKWPQFKYVQCSEALSPKHPHKTRHDLLSEPNSHLV